MGAVAKYLDYPEFTPFITDMRLQVGSPPWVNVNRSWMAHPFINQSVTREDLEEFVRECQSINDESDLNTKGRELDFAFSAELNGEVHRFRGHESRNYMGMAIDVRVLRAGIPTFPELGFSEKLATTLVTSKTGLVLVGGPTGSGKSTTLSSLVDAFARTHPGSHIVTLEDPVEYIIRREDCLVSQKQVPVHVETFERGIFEAKREKPDLIVIGEMRTREALRAAVEAAMSGHLVLATTFADRIPRVLEAIKDSFAPQEQEGVRTRLGYLLRGVICQVLAPSDKPNQDGWALPELAYEVLCNDEPWVASLLRKGAWANLEIKASEVKGCSSSWEARVNDLHFKGHISASVCEFLKLK